MNQINAARTVPDPSLCEHEQIHIPGAIQGHGAVLAALPDGSVVTHASANLGAILGLPAEQALGQTLHDVLGDAACRAILRNPEARSDNAMSSIAAPGGNMVQLRSNRSGHRICIDIEPVLAEAWQRPTVSLARSVLDTFKQAATGQRLCELAVQGLRTITGYDRVMALRFDKDGDGEVIAEACQAHLEPYLGMHYPAMDVPPQARRQYLIQSVVMLADATADPVPLMTRPELDDGTPLDLTHSALRSISPVHREYMRNMKTTASLTVGLAPPIRPDRQLPLGRVASAPELWGLLVCHHAGPRIAGAELRAAVAMIGEVVALLLGGFAATEVQTQRLDRAMTLSALADGIAAPAPLLQTFAALEAEVLHLVGAEGAIIRHAGGVLLLGRTPPPAEAEHAMDVLAQEANGQIMAHDDTGLRFPALAGCAARASGTLLLPLSAPSGQSPSRQHAADAILWFRPERAQTITWGGDPAAHVQADPATGRLSPRGSFAAWQAVVSGRAEPWGDADLTLALDLQRFVSQELARRAEAALYLFERLVETSPFALVLAGQDGRIKMLNRQVERMFGYRREALQDQPLEMLMPERFGAAHIQLRRGFMASPVSRAMGQGLHLFGRRGDGTEFPIEIALEPIPSAGVDAEPMVQANITDITARLEIEQERELRRRDLERSNAELEEFSYAVSHDLKAPLRAIGHLSQWISEDIGPAAEPATLENLRLLQTRVSRMQKLLDGLLEYSRIGRTATSAESVDIAEVVGDIVALLAPPPGFVVTMQGDAPLIRTECAPIRLVLANLIVNALKHHDLDHGRITISARLADGMAEVRVSDDGPGIASAFHHRIFGMFQTLQSRDAHEASGLGLAIAKRHVETHGGKIWVESAPPVRGSSFVFTWRPVPA